jgi:hypothetical protein
MKSIPYTLLLTLVLATTAAADTIVQWNFNSNPPDASSSTGTNVPSLGTGKISVIGTVIQNVSATVQYSTGDTAAGPSTDPATGDDSAYHTRNYPLQGEGNKTSGIQVNVSTVGFENIVVTWDQQNSATANRYLRFQYSRDGSNFEDYVVLTKFVAGAFVNNRTVNLGPILAANGNPNFAFRLVSEFESTATGSGTDQYVGTASGYTANGTMRFDMLTVSGSLPDGNAFPTITSIQNQTTREGTPTDPLPFQVGDVETPADQLNVTGSSSNPTLVPDTGIIIEGAGANRTVTVGPNFDETGTTTITLYVIDGGGKSNSTSFVVTVLAGNTPPTISALTNVHTVVSTAFAAINFTVADAEQSSDTLGVAAISSDQTIIPDGNLTVSDGGASRTLTMTPAPGQVGNCVITVIATDSEGLSTTRTFNAMIVPSSSIVLSEPFNYTDGPLTTNSAALWTTRAGTPGQMQIVFGTALVTASQSEDVVARLIGGPYETGASTVLYASFDISFSAPPTGAPDIFAHFSGTNANDLRARVLTSTNAPPGSFRLGVANTVSSAANVADYPLDLSLDTTYQVVVCYDVAAGTSKLWVNPASGGGWVNAIDPVLPTPINAYGLRQPGPSGRIGDSRMDNLLVGLSFEAVTPNLTRVRIRRAGSAIEVSWPSSSVWEGFRLESTTSLANPDWQFVNQPAITVEGWDVVTISNPTGNEFFRLIKP